MSNFLKKLSYYDSNYFTNQQIKLAGETLGSKWKKDVDAAKGGGILSESDQKKFLDIRMFQINAQKESLSKKPGLYEYLVREALEYVKSPGKKVDPEKSSDFALDTSVRLPANPVSLPKTNPMDLIVKDLEVSNGLCHPKYGRRVNDALMQAAQEHKVSGTIMTLEEAKSIVRGIVKKDS